MLIRWPLAVCAVFFYAIVGCAQETKHVHTNHLINETSPYLLQHAHNPVNWYPWGEEAFEKARKENKPIFLSVGYSTCYWCHVMEKGSFEDEEVAEIINKHFIAIKVDREERPDIDEQYMLITQMLRGRGGWPNSVWLTPDGKPWMAGTYFPKQQFMVVLNELHNVWTNRRDDVDRQADALADAAKRASLPSDGQTTELSQQLVDQAVAKLVGQFDARNGGFGGAPKFPPHGTLALLIQQFKSTNQDALSEPITKTLDAMWLGGMHDHLGGGFHRYATDADWLLPHFEKMLYDNAQLMNVYADGYVVTNDERYRAAVADIYRWVKREMTDPEGAFYSALDSGEVDKEGEAYVWSMNKLIDVLGQDDATLFAEIYNFQSDGNFEDEASGQKTGENIPHLEQPIESIAKSHSLGTQQLLDKLDEIQDKLLADRLTWPQPHKDDKILASWNGLMIQSLAHAGRVLDQPQYTQAASDAANFVLKSMVRDGKLLRTYRGGTAKLPGYLDDYVYFCNALIELHLATNDQRWLDHAVKFAEILLTEFEDEQDGGFYFTGNSHEELMVRSKHLGGGGNMPNSNGIAAQVLIKLSDLTGEQRYRTAAKKTLSSLSGLMAAQPHTTEHLQIALAMFLEGESDSSIVDAPTSKRIDPISLQLTVPETPVQRGESGELMVTIKIDPQWHLYADNPDVDFVIPTEVSVSSESKLTIGKVVAPKGESRVDPFLKKTINTYKGTIQFHVPLVVPENFSADVAKLNVTIKFQACDQSKCLKPQQTTMTIDVNVDGK